MKPPLAPDNGLFTFDGNAEADAFRRVVWRRLHALRRMRTAFQAQVAGRSFEGRHVQKGFSRILLDAFESAGFEVFRFDGQAFLRSPTSDEYMVSVRRKDDRAPHWLPLYFRAPLDLEGAWRIVRRAERWLRSRGRR